MTLRTLRTTLASASRCVHPRGGAFSTLHSTSSLHTSSTHTLMSDALSLDEIDTDLFLQAASTLWNPPGARGVYGGQIIGAAMQAAQRTLSSSTAAPSPSSSLTSSSSQAHRHRPRRLEIHSLHSYFLLPGDRTRPIVYHVNRLRDGGSFSTRTVTARQNGNAIFQATFSFHNSKEKGILQHQPEMPIAPPPESLPSMQEEVETLLRDPRIPPSYGPLLRAALAPFPVDVRPVLRLDPIHPKPVFPATQLLWIRCTEALPEKDSLLHRSAIAFASDWSISATCLLPYGLSYRSPQVRLAASLDHSMYFHESFEEEEEEEEEDDLDKKEKEEKQTTTTIPKRKYNKPVRADEWLLYELKSPIGRGVRGLSTGNIFTREGKLVCTVVQEALIRMKGVVG